MLELRGDEVSRPGPQVGTKAAPPIQLPRGPLSFADEDNAHVDEAPTRVADVHMLERQLDEIKSELAALHLQLEVNEEEKKAVAKENDETNFNLICILRFCDFRL